MRISIRAAIFAATALGATAVFAQNMDAVEITATPLKPGVSVLFGNGGNIGVSHGADGTILIDDQFAELSAKIQQAVSDLGAQPATYMINTHYHFDHAGGNENFGNAGAIIVAHENVRTRLADGSAVLGNVTPPAPAAALPVLTYDQGMTIHFNGDVLDLMFLGGGHTDGDSVVMWREANVVHMGDMFMHNLGWPFIDVDSGGNVEHLLGSLAQVIAMTDPDTIIIPGHGEIATRADLIGFRTMIQTGVDRVKALKDQGLSVEETVAAKPVDGLRNAEGFIADDDFVAAVWASLDAHRR